MTKEEAYSVWMAAVESGSDTAHIYRSWYNFNDWWRARSAKPEEATQTTTTGDGIPYEYISSTSTAPDSFFGRVTSAGSAKDTES